MIGIDHGKIPHYKATEAGKLEARRLFYVGLTRAKQEVHIAHRKEVVSSSGRRIAGPSEFLLELQAQLDKEFSENKVQDG